MKSHAMALIGILFLLSHMLNHGNSSCQCDKEKTHSAWETPTGAEVRVTVSKLLHPALSSHSTVFMTPVNILTITALVTQIFMSFPNKSVFLSFFLA